MREAARVVLTYVEARLRGCCAEVKCDNGAAFLSFLLFRARWHAWASVPNQRTVWS